MTKQMNVPKLRFGEFDVNWQHYSIKETISALVDCEHKTAPYVDAQDYMVVRTNNIKNGSLLMDDMKYTSKDGFDEWTKRAVPSFGDILFTREAPAGESCLVPKDTNLCLGQRMVLLQIDQSVMNSVFISQLLLSPKVQNTISSYCIGSTVTRINIADINRIDFDIPTLPEQKKVASFLSKVDEKITLLTEKKTKLTEYKKGVMQQLFDGKWQKQEGKLVFVQPTLRFKADDGSEFPDWESKKGNELFDSISDKNHNSDLPVLAITQSHGAIPRDLIDYQVSVADSSIASYKVVGIGDFIISLRSFQGGIEYSAYKGICSPAYVILRAKLDIVDDFYKPYLKTFSFILEMQKRLEGIRDGKIISYKYFSEIKIPYPSIAEQEKIAGFVNAIDKKIELTQTELSKAKEWKKGLLQQMFV